jgi:hypothetical protein
MRKIILIVSILFIVGLAGIVNAQEALPKGGDGFETAIEIVPGVFKGRSLKSHEVEYFYVADVRPGQEIRIKGTFTPETDLSAIATVDLYDENRTDLGVGCYESGEGTMDIPCEVSWVTNSDKESYKYYIKTGSDTWNITSYRLEVSLINHYDAGSQTDAGDTVEKAIEVTSGEYTGYLSGEAGADTKDFYKAAVEKGKTLTVKATPPSGAIMRVVVYDKDRKVLKDEYAPNAGAIVTNSVTMAKSGDLFIAVICDRYCSKNLVAYALDVTTEGAPIEGAEAEEGAPYGVEGAGGVAGAVGKGIATVIILWIVVPIVFLIIIGVVIYLVLKKKKQL